MTESNVSGITVSHKRLHCRIFWFRSSVGKSIYLSVNAATGTSCHGNLVRLESNETA